MTTGPVRVLLVEDDPDDARMVLVAMERDHSVKIVHVRTGADAMQALDEAPVQACLVDHRLPDTNGVDLIRRIRGTGFAGPLIMVSGVREDRVVQRALDAGANDFLQKDLEYGDEVPQRLRLHLEA